MKYLILSLLLCTQCYATHVSCHFPADYEDYDGKVQISGTVYRVDDVKTGVHWVPVNACIVDGELNQ